MSSTAVSLRRHRPQGHPVLLEITGGPWMQRPVCEMSARGCKVLGRRVKLTDAVGMVTDYAGNAIHHVLADAGVEAQEVAMATVGLASPPAS